MSEQILSLAREFPPVTLEDWRRLAARALRGKDLESLVSRTLDDVPVGPLYTRADAVPGEGLPGVFPRLRGGRPAADLPDAWDVRQLHRHPDPGIAAAEIAEDLAGGVRSIWLRLDRRMIAGGDGADGTLLLEPGDLAPILAACTAAGAPLVLDPGGDFRRVAALLPAPEGDGGARLEFAADPLGAAVAGEHPDPAAALATMAELVPRLAGRPGETRILWASGLPWHDAGASDVQELAATLATAISYLRLLGEAGLGTAEAARRIGLRLAADPDVFATAAKLRAARRLWAQVMRHCGIEEVPPYLHAVTAARMMTRYDPWNNMLRVTAATLAAALGGADAITALPFDHAIGLPDRFARRIARNTQLVLALESGLHHPLDPLGGSWFAGRFCDELARRAWELLREIEAAGGMSDTLREGWLQERVAAVRARRFRDLARRLELQVGVGGFADLDETPRRPPAPDLSALRRRLAATRATADVVAPERGEPRIRVLEPVRLAEPFERLRDLGEARLAREGRRPAVLLATFGRPAACIALVAMARNLFEAGGIAAVEVAGEEGVEDFDPARTPFAVLCLGEREKADAAVEVARRLRRAGAKRLYLAGGENGGEFDAVLRDGLDAPALLADAWRAIGERPS